MHTEFWSIDPNPIHYGYFEDFPFFRKGNDMHECYAVYFLEKGAFEYRIGNGETQLLSAGEAVICPPNTNFSKCVKETVTMHLMGISLEGNIPIMPSTPVEYASDTRISETLSRLKSLVRQTDIPIEKYRSHLILDLWYCLCQRFHSPFTPYFQRVETDPVYREMVAYIENHPETSLSELSSVFGYSRVTVNKMFRSYTGETVGNFIKKIRIERACRLLIQTDQPYKSIAPICGFANEYYFSAVFKSVTGCTPGQYRKNKAMSQ